MFALMNKIMISYFVVAMKRAGISSEKIELVLHHFELLEAGLDGETVEDVVTWGEKETPWTWGELKEDILF